MMLPSPDRIYAILEEHERCADLQHFVKAHAITHKNVSQRTWIKIREVKQMDTILKRLKQNNKV